MTDSEIELPERIYSVDGAWTHRETIHNQLVAITGLLHLEFEGNCIRHWPHGESDRSMDFELMFPNTLGFDMAVIDRFAGRRVIAVGVLRRYSDDDPTRWANGLRGLAYGHGSLWDMQIKLEQMYRYRDQPIFA